MIKVTGLDLSLTRTGLAHLALIRGVTPTAALEVVVSKAAPTQYDTKGKPLPATLPQRHARLLRVRDEIVRCCRTSDVVVIETPAHDRTSGHHHDRSGLWWLVVAELMKSGASTLEISTSSLKVYATGKGTISKDQVMLAVANRYRDLVEVTGSDEADALALAAMTARQIGYPIEASLPQTHLRALDGVRWPDDMEL